ncbi:MAG: hypothetical protein LUI06_01145 [Ruminococcus sp.]|nr:hypothetical protein [Ruminococcus sp.]
MVKTASGVKTSQARMSTVWISRAAIMFLGGTIIAIAQSKAFAIRLLLTCITRSRIS